MDEWLLLVVNGARSPAIDPVAGFLSEWGIFAFLVVLVVRAIATRTREDLVSMQGGWLAFFVASNACDTVMKPLIARPRPTATASLEGMLHVLGHAPPATSTSFPSGTAAACAAGATWIWIRFGPRAGIAAVLYAVLVSLTRVYAGLHWPTDLIAGGCVGALVAFGVKRLNERIA